MARAKRTDRAEARRRYRAEMGLTDDPGEEGADGEAQPVAGSGTGRAQPATKRAAAPSGRLGIGAAFRQSIHPLNVREDLRSLPSLVRHKAMWLPVLITVGSTVLVFAVGAENFVAALLYTYFIQSPAIGGVFLAGFLAPRASWLIGVIVGLVSAVCYTAIIASGIVGTPNEAVLRDVVVSAFVLSPVLGGLFAASAAWYRRFLQLSNPNRGRQAAAKRGGSGSDGRSRSSGAAKTR